MYEELYIIDKGVRLKVDLAIPSGITLNFKSNIFGDLSKITCSYSYTFKLPLTANNRRVFDNADDIRATSDKVRKRLKAVYIQNGIPLFENANLYIDSTENHFNAVMTWGVIDGFQTLKDDDISIKELPLSSSNGIARFGIKTAIPRPTDWSNGSDYFIPYRTSEEGYFYCNQQYIYGYERTNGSSMLPVVPVKRLIDMINSHFGTQFYFGDQVNGSSLWNTNTHKFNPCNVPDLIAFGAVPLVKRDLTDVEYIVRTGVLKDVEVLNNSFWGIALKVWDDCTAYNVISYNYQAPPVNNYFDIGNNGSTSGTTRKYTFFKKSGAYVEKVELDGYIRVTMSNIGSRWKGSKLEYSRTDVIPKLIIYKRNWKLKEGSTTNGEIVYDEAATLEGKYLGANVVVSGEYTYEFYTFEFDFRDENGRNRLALDDFNSSSETYPYFMSINDTVRSVDEVSEFKIVPKGNITNNVNLGWEVDIMSNLPDISCLTFMKSLYYMIGAFPSIDSSGKVIPLFYNDFRKNILSSNVYDWSDKLTNYIAKVPDKISYAVSGFVQKNYYLMKNDDLDRKDSSEREDVYESGIGCIVCENETLNKSNTIIQIPFYGAFLQDASRPNYETGHDMKYKKFKDDDTTEFCEAKPAIGIIRPIEQCKYLSTENPPVCQGLGTYAMLLHIWDGFKNILENESYNYLQTIMLNPLVITESINLTELDIKDLDYSIPVYLSKYGAFFAIVSITRDSKGISKCELLKLPEEE